MGFLITKRPASKNWWAACGRVLWFGLLSLLLVPFVGDWIIAVTMAVIFRSREPYAQWEPRRYKEWKLPWETSLLILFWVFMSGVIFVWTFLEIVHEPTPRPRQIRADSLDPRKTSHDTTVQSPNSLQATSDVFELEATSKVLELGATSNVLKPEATSNVPEVEAFDVSPPWDPNERRTYEEIGKRRSTTGPFQSLSPADTPFPSPTVKSSDEHHASSQSDKGLNANAVIDTPCPKQSSRNIADLDTPEREREADPNAVSPVNSSFNPSAYSPASSQTPRVEEVEEDPVTADARALISFSNTMSLELMPQYTAHHENSQHQNESGVNAASSPAPTENSQHENEADFNAASSPAHTASPVSLIPSASADTAPLVSPDDIKASCRENLLREIDSWRYAPTRDRIEKTITFASKNPEKVLSIPSSTTLEPEVRRLELLASQGSALKQEPFTVYDTPELSEYNLLRCWVYLNQHVLEQPWPQGYVPKSTKEELAKATQSDCDDDGQSIWSEPN